MMCTWRQTTQQQHHPISCGIDGFHCASITTGNTAIATSWRHDVHVPHVCVVAAVLAGCTDRPTPGLAGAVAADWHVRRLCACPRSWQRRQQRQRRDPWRHRLAPGHHDARGRRGCHDHHHGALPGRSIRRLGDDAGQRAGVRRMGCAALAACRAAMAGTAVWASVRQAGTGRAHRGRRRRACCVR